MPIITIRGEYGSGVSDIGKQIAQRLQVDYVDHKIISEVAARLQRGEQMIEEKETPPSNIMGRVAQALSIASMDYSIAYIPAEDVPIDDARYLETLESVITELAKSRSIVIHGRGSQFILKDYPEAIHIYLIAPIEVRLKRIVESLKVSEERAKQEIIKLDNIHREFTKRYFKAAVENPIYYDMIINTAKIDYDTAVTIIIDAQIKKEQSHKK